MILQHSRLPLFPYTTLFRSVELERAVDGDAHRADLALLRCAFANGGGDGFTRRKRLRRARWSHVVCWSDRRRLVTRGRDRKSTRRNSSHLVISYAVFCLENK